MSATGHGISPATAGGCIGMLLAVTIDLREVLRRPAPVAGEKKFDHSGIRSCELLTQRGHWASLHFHGMKPRVRYRC